MAVGPEGGKASVGDMSLYVPAGAVEGSVTLSSQLYTSHCKFPPVDSAKDEYIFSPVLSLHPRGHQFKQPVLVKCPFNAVPGGWRLVLFRANCQKSEESRTWEEIVVYNTDTREVITTDCSYDVNQALLSISHFCDHCWIGKPIANFIFGRKQLHCSAFGSLYNKQWTIDVIMHDRCRDIFKVISLSSVLSCFALTHELFQNLQSEQLQKFPPRLYFDGPESLAIDRHSDVTCKIESSSWQADPPEIVRMIY